MAGADVVRAPSMEDLAASIAGLLREFRENPEHPALVGNIHGNPVQTRPAFPSAGDFTKALVTGVTNNAAKYADGVRRPRRLFTDNADQTAKAYTAGVQAAIARNAFAGGMAKVNADEAIELAATLGAQSYVPGVTARAGKIQRIMGDVAPMMAAAVETVRRLPATTDAEREARAVAMIKAARVVGQARRGAR